LERAADIYEVAGSGDELRSGGKVTIREPQFILQSAENVAARMASAGIEIPVHRQSQNHQLALNILSAAKTDAGYQGSDPRAAALDMMGPAGVTKALVEEYEKLKDLQEQGKIPKGKNPLRARWNSLMNTFKTRSTSRTHIQHLLEQNQEIEALERIITNPTSTKEDVEEARRKWEVLCEKYHEDVKNISFHASDAALCSILAARRGLELDPPVLMWDRRKFEPLVVNEDEFMSRKTMALLDIQPKALVGASPAKDYERFDDFLLPLFNAGPTVPVTKALESLSPGLSSQLIERTKLLRDPARGGRLDVSDLRVCMLSLEMIEDLVKAWSEFPWRPPGAESSRYFRTKLLSGNLIT
jgi:mitochondrial transcription factor 1